MYICFDAFSNGLGVCGVCWPLSETVVGPIRAPAEAERFQAETPSMFNPGWTGALECRAIDRSLIVGVTEVEDVESMMRTQK